MDLKDGIWAWRLGFKPGGWDLSLEAEIWASILEFRPLGKDLGEMDGGKEQENST